MNIHEVIKNVRKSESLTLDQMSQKIGGDKAMVYRYEKDTVPRDQIRVLESMEEMGYRVNVNLGSVSIPLLSVLSNLGKLEIQKVG